MFIFGIEKVNSRVYIIIRKPYPPPPPSLGKWIFPSLATYYPVPTYVQRGKWHTTHAP